MPDDARPDEFEALLRPLWLRAQEGDDWAYREALMRLTVRLRGWLRRRMSSLPDEVEDLLQETLLALHLQRGTWDEQVPVSAWALAIARHKLVDLWRRRGRREDLHDTLDDVDEALLVAAPDEGLARRDLYRLLRELPEAQREVIMMTKLQGLSVAEAAAMTGATESGVKVNVHRGLKRLAQWVRKEQR